MKPNFEPISDMTQFYPRDYALYDPSILNPLATNPLIDGEWLHHRLVGSVIQLDRGSGLEAIANCGPWWGERGRYDTQAYKGVPIIWMFNFEAFTRVCNTTGLTTPGQLLSVTDVTVDGVANKRGLRLSSGAGATSGDLYFARYVSPGRTTGEIRFVREAPGFIV